MGADGQRGTHTGLVRVLRDKPGPTGRICTKLTRLNMNDEAIRGMGGRLRVGAIHAKKY